MSAETLRRAATELRAVVNGGAPGTVSEPEFNLAVADWLDDAAENLAMQAPGGDLREHWDMRVHIAGAKALAAARAYLGESS